MIGLLPLLEGAVQLTSAWLVAALAVTAVGAVGGVGTVGTTTFDSAETGPEPLALEACTVKV